MIEYLRERIKDKSVLILGFGREGRSTLNLIHKAKGARSIGIADANQVQCEITVDALHIGRDYQKCLNDYDIVFKSPGIVLERDISEYTCDIVSQMEIFFERYKNQIIGITGTKGKSTTTTLLYHILDNSNVEVLLAGNIGIPVFEIVDQMKETTTAVLELSCHQLEYMDVGAKRGIYLNLHEEHLDHYGTMEKYTHAKENIYRHQNAGDKLFCLHSLMPGKDYKGNAVLLGMEGECNKDQVDYFLAGDTIYFSDGKYVIPTDEIKLLGEHNYFDIAFVYAVCRDFGVSDDDFSKALKTYNPLPHRLQFIGNIGGIKWYDDSISTIDETTIQALNTLKDADTVLIGGMDRGISYENLEKYLANSPIPNIILMEETGRRIADEIRKNHPEFKDVERIHKVEHLEDAVKLAKEITGQGRSCVLSPAAASYGIFKNFEERGDVFARLVKN